MSHFRVLLTTAALLAISLSTAAQDYSALSRFCVTCGGEPRTGFFSQYTHEGTKVTLGFCSSLCRAKFSQDPGTHMTKAITALKIGAVKKEKKVAPDATGPCDVKRIVKAPFCVSCDRELSKDDVLANKTCKRCETKPVMIEYCLKMGDAEIRARISYACESCSATGELEADFKHEEGCKPKIGGGLKKVCSKSGMAPHATDKK